MRKELYESYFKDRRVTVMGLGLLGRGIGDTAFLASCGADIIVTDTKTEIELQESCNVLKDYTNITYHLGGHTMEDFENRDCIIKAAGVPLDSIYIAHARKHNIPVYMSAALICQIVMKELPDVVIIGVTGTRGKSMTTHAIAHILESNNHIVHLCGNIRGVANLPILESISDGDFLVLELDSWQLQGFGDLKISPHISVFTSFMDDHMNYYKNDRVLYFNDKANIYRYQKEFDVTIASNQAYEAIKKYDKKKGVIIPEEKIFETHLLGAHNQISLGIAYEVATQCGLDDDSIITAIKTFKGVEGRLEYMGEFRGVKVFNDNNATTSDATVKAIESVYATYAIKPIIIMGGTDKGLSLDTLEKEVTNNTKAHILLSGSGTEKLHLSKDYLYETLEECVRESFNQAQEGDVILFSPAFASFSSYFNNEYERNDVFVSLLQKYR